MFIVTIFYMFLFISLGAAIIKYRKVVKSWTGNFVWAEQHIGSGSTYLIIIFIGMGLIFFGVIYPFGGMEFLFGNKTGIVQGGN